MTDMVIRYYTGPIDSVSLAPEDGRELEVSRGDQVEVSVADAARLDAQNSTDATLWAERETDPAVQAARALTAPDDDGGQDDPTGAPASVDPTQTEA